MQGDEPWHATLLKLHTAPMSFDGSPRPVPLKELGIVNLLPTEEGTPFESDSVLKNLLCQKVVQYCNETHKTLQECRWHVLCQVAGWLPVPHVLDAYEDEIPTRQLLALSLRDIRSKQPVPHDESEGTRHLTLWLRQNSNASEIKSRNMCRLLAVDGFEGLEPKYLKAYLKLVLNPTYLRHEYRVHVIAVRKMYERFDARPDVSGLTGTDAGCVVFLALLQLYMRELNLLDHQVAQDVAYVRERVENGLERRDVRTVVTENVLTDLGQAYKDAWKGQPGWRQVGLENLRGIHSAPYTE